MNSKMVKFILWVVLASLLFSCNGPNPKWEELDQWSIDAIIAEELESGVPFYDIYEKKYPETDFHGYYVFEFIKNDIRNRLDSGESYNEISNIIYPAFYFDEWEIRELLRPQVEIAFNDSIPLEGIYAGFPEKLVNDFRDQIRDQFSTRISDGENFADLIQIFPSELIIGALTSPQGILAYVDTTLNHYLIVRPQETINTVIGDNCSNLITGIEVGSGSNNTTEMISNCSFSNINPPTGFHLPSLNELKAVKASNVISFYAFEEYLTSSAILDNSNYMFYYYDNGNYEWYALGTSGRAFKYFPVKTVSY
jgi:hypothetical protein